MAGLGAAASGSSGAIRAGRAFVEFFIKDDAVTRGLAKVQAAIRGAVAAAARHSRSMAGTVFSGLHAAAANVGAALVRGLEKARDSARKVGGALLAGGVVAGAGIAKATGVFIEFDDAMRLAGATAEATASELADMTAKAKELAKAGTFSAREIARVMVELAKAGARGKTLENMTEAVTNLTRATGADPVMAAEAVVSVMSQFGLGMDQATRSADGMTAAANKSIASVESLFASFKYAGPIGRDLNATLEDTLALIAGMANLGIKGSEAGTGLRRLFSISSTHSEALGRLGVRTRDAAGNLLPLVDILDALGQMTAKMGTAERMQALEEVFGMLSITHASALSKAPASVRELADAIKNAGGLAADTAKKIDAGAGGAWRRFKNSVEAVALEFADALTPAMKAASDILGGMARAVATFFKENRQAAGLIVAVAGGLTAAGVAGLALSGILAGLVAGLKILGASASFLAVGGLLYLGVRELAQRFPELAEAVKGWGRSLAETFGFVRESFQGIGHAVAAGDFALAFEIGLKAVQATYAEFMAQIAEPWHDFVSIVRGVWDTVVTVVAAGVGAVAAAVGPTLGQIGSITGNVFGDIIEGWKAAQALIQIGLEHLGAAFERGWEYIGTVIGNVLRFIQDKAVTVVLAVVRALDSVDPTDSLKDTIEHLEGLKAGVSDVARHEAWHKMLARLEEISAQREHNIKAIMQAHSEETKARAEGRTAAAEEARKRAEALKEELRLLNERARLLKTGGGAPDAVISAAIQAALAAIPKAAGSMTTLAPWLAATPTALPPRPTLGAGSVAGGFATPRAAEQFAFARTFERQQLNAAQKTAVNTGEIAQRMADLSQLFRFGQ